MASSSSSTVNKIEMAHLMYREGKYLEALDCYTDALSLAKTNPQKIALHSNRAACFLKLHHFHQQNASKLLSMSCISCLVLTPPRYYLCDLEPHAAEECTSVLEIDRNHTGALMLRAQTLVTLKEYHSALFDVNRLIELSPSSEAYKNLQTRLKTQMSLAPIPEDKAEFGEEEEENDFISEKMLEETEEEQDNKEVEECVNEENNRTSDSAKDNFDKSALPTISPETEGLASKSRSTQKQPDEQPLSWNTVPKPKGHSNLDYSKWDRVEDDSSEEDDSDDGDDDSQPQYRFRVKTVGVKAVK